MQTFARVAHAKYAADTRWNRITKPLVEKESEVTTESECSEHARSMLTAMLLILILRSFLPLNEKRTRPVGRWCE